MRNDVKTCEPNLHFNIIDQIMQIPQQIIDQHYQDNLADLVLHDIASENCLAFSKAAYLVDNPDFNALKGICGYNKNFIINSNENLMAQLQKSDYNCKVKQFSKPSSKAQNKNPLDPSNLQLLAEELDIKNPRIHSWNLKHNNHGLLIFEMDAPSCCDWKDSLIQKVSNILSFCAI